LFPLTLDVLQVEVKVRKGAGHPGSRPGSQPINGAKTSLE